MVYPQAKHQRCWVHKMRNVLGRLKVKQRDACVSQLRTVYQSKNITEARERYRAWADAWRKEAPEAVACVEKDLEELLSFLSEPVALAKKLRTTNVIERSFREVRRRTNPMSSFNNRESCERIIYAIFTTRMTAEGSPHSKVTHNT